MTGPQERRVWWGVTACLALVMVGWGVVSTVRGWRPAGDDAFLVMRARDVLSAHPPLLSTASSGGASSGIEYNHPGPIVQYLNAPFVAVLGTSGAALANAVLNAACIVGVSLLARRAARPAVAAAVLACSAGVVWAMGSGVLISPWNPNIATLPFLLGVVALWGTLRGDPLALPVGVLGASISLQTHLAFVAPSAAVLVGLGAAAALRTRAADRGSTVRTAWVRSWWAALAVGFLSVLAPLLQQLANGSEGNVARLVRGAEFAEAQTGVGRVLSTVVEVLVVPPWFLRGSWAGSIYDDQLLPTALAIGGAVVVAVAVAATLVSAHRRSDREVFDLTVVATVLLVIAAFVAVRFPLRTGVPVPYFRWLWPLAALLAAALLARPVELAAGATSRRLAPLVWLALAGVFVLGTLVPYGADAGASPPWAQELADSLLVQAGESFDEFVPGESVRIEASIQEAALILLPSVIEDLARRGVTVTMTDPVLVQQSGAHRRSDGTDDWAIVPVGPDTSLGAGPEGGRRIAWVRPLDPNEEEQLDRDLAEAVERIRSSEVRLGPGGAHLDESTGIPALVERAASDPEGFISSWQLSSALRHGLVVVDGVDAEELAEVSERASARAGRSIALWLVPGG